jgi:hypothetical protein
MSLTHQSELTLDVVRDAFARWLGVDATGLERIGGGRNSQVYRVTLATGSGLQVESSKLAPNFQPSTFNLQPSTCALKAYFRHADDQRDRLATEYNSFNYLWANGFREIPQPLACDPEPGWAVYQFIEGEKIPPGEVTEAHVLAAVDFLGRLRELSREPASRKLGEASEACLAPALIVHNVRARLDRLRPEAKDQSSEAQNPEPETTHHASRITHHASAPSQSEARAASSTPADDIALRTELHTFLDRDFTPLLQEVARWSESRLNAAGISFTTELDWAGRTLSPSDFGFHNALRRPDGRVIFLDFEYFGWDDPAKMIADFLLHPAMNLPVDLKRTFASAIFRRFADWPGLRMRVESVYPLFGLKWCMIMLNEFLPDSYLRRQFAAAAPEDRSALQRRQLEKARQMLAQIRREYERFPYCD